MAICKTCNEEYKAKRSTSKYCSAKCRKLAFLSVPEENGKSLSVPNEQPIAVTLKNGKLDADIPDFETDLPDHVPFPVVNRYERPDEHEYRDTIDRLVGQTLDELRSLGVWIPCWRLHAGA
jgi:hypothetical protein